MRDVVGSLFFFICVSFTTGGVWIGLVVVFAIINAIFSSGQAVAQPRLFFLFIFSFLVSGSVAVYLCVVVWKVWDEVAENTDELMTWYQSLGWFPKAIVKSTSSALVVLLISWLLGIPGDYKLLVVPIGAIILYIGISIAL